MTTQLYTNMNTQLYTLMHTNVYTKVYTKVGTPKTDFLDMSPAGYLKNKCIPLSTSFFYILLVWYFLFLSGL